MNGWDVAIAVFVFVVIVACEHIDRRVPGALIGLVIATAVTATLGAAATRCWAPSIAGCRRSASLGLLADVRGLVGPALTIAFLCVVQTAATVHASGAGTQAPDDFDRDLVAFGAGTFFSGLIGSFAVNASPPGPRSCRASGGRTQLTAGRGLRRLLAVVFCDRAV